MICNKFDVIATAFPFLDKPGVFKVRPAVVVSSDEYNKNTGFLVIVMITSAKNSKLWNDIKILNPQDLELTHVSFIRMKFANISKNAVLHKMGKLVKEDQENLKKSLKNIF